MSPHECGNRASSSCFLLPLGPFRYHSPTLLLQHPEVILLLSCFLLPLAPSRCHSPTLLLRLTLLRPASLSSLSPPLFFFTRTPNPNPAPTHKRSSFTSKVYSVIQANKVGCRDVPEWDCALVCNIKIHVVAGKPPLKIKITQDSEDQNEIRVHGADVAVQELFITGVGTEVALLRVSVAGKLTAKVKTAPINVTECAVGSALLWATSAPVYVERPVVAVGQSVEIKHRSNSNAVALIRDASAAPLAYPASPWGLCSLTLDLWASKTRAFYDMDNNYKVTPDEFNEGIGKLPKCCGSQCPFRSLCKSLEWSVFPAGLGGATKGYLFMNDFFEAIKATNDTTLVPNCHQMLTAPAPAGEVAAAGTTPLPLSYMVRADSANIRVDLAKDSRNSPNTTTTTCLQGTPGVQLLSDEIANIKEQVQADFGESSAAADLIAVFDIVGNGHVPGGRWVWATRPVYLDLEPIWIEFFSAGVLLPEVKHFRVYMSDHICPGTPVDAQSVRTAIFMQLRTAIKPRLQAEMRGVLVYVEHDHYPRPLSSNLSTWFKDTATKTWKLTRYVSPQHDLTTAITIISSALALFVAFIGVTAFNSAAASKLEDNSKTSELRKKIQKMRTSEAKIKGATPLSPQEKENYKEENPEDGAEDDMKEHKKGPNGPFFAAFETPMQMINVLLIFPIRRRTINSLQVFVNQRCFTYEDYEKKKTKKKTKKTNNGKIKPEQAGNVKPEPTGHQQFLKEASLSMSQFLTRYVYGLRVA